MSYINNCGKSLGPLKIEEIWLKNNVQTHTYFSSEGAKITTNVRYMQFLKNKNDQSSLAPLQAGTPIFGYDEGNNLATPDSSVVTVGWLRLYGSLEPGTLPFDPNKYVTKDDLALTNNRVTSLEKITSSHELSIKTSIERIAKNEKDISINTTNIDKNKENINSLKGQFNTYVDNPFPDGIWIECGGAS